MNNKAIMHSSVWFVLGLVLAFLGLWPCAGLAQMYSGSKVEVYDSYEDFAQAKGYLRVTATMEDEEGAGGGSVTVEQVWQEGWEPGDDPDGDGYTNQEEFEGTSATLNGLNGVFSSLAQGGAIYFGPGSDGQLYDTDGDAISDMYELYYTKTDPNKKDSDGDGMYDSVEAYAGLNPMDGGLVYDYVFTKGEFVYTTKVYRASGGVYRETPHTNTYIIVSAMNPQKEAEFEYDAETDTYTPIEDVKDLKTTQQHPDFDIDGDGLTNKEEVKAAMDAIDKDYQAPERRTAGEKPFRNDILDGGSWTSPLRYDSDGDRLVDSFERAFSGFNPSVSEEGESAWSEDKDHDGLVNVREQCMHPLLSSGWAKQSYRDNELNTITTPIYPSTSCDVWYNAKIGLRYSGSAVLFGVPGYLLAAQFGKAGDVQRHYTVSKAGSVSMDGDLPVWTPAETALAGSAGNVFWMPPSSYWTDPSKVDTDGDSLPDGWEVEYGLNALAGGLWGPSGQLGDPDQDGLVNYEEYWGQDGHRIDRITGTGDETIPWVARGLNYPNQLRFDDFISHEDGKDWYIGRELWQAPSLFDTGNLCEAYSETLYPGFFQAASRMKLDLETGVWTEVSNTAWVANGSIPVGEETTSGIVKTPVKNYVPVPGVPAPCFLNDMYQLAEGYGEDFLVENNPALPDDGEGAFQPFATAYGNIFYYEDPDADPDGRYTPGVDALWYAGGASDGVYKDFESNGDLVLSDPNGLLTGDQQGYPLYDNIPLMMPMPGRDTDNDGLVDSMEIQMDIARDKYFSSPVVGLNPLVMRSARIVNSNGMQAAFSTDLYIFSRQFSVEAWVYLSGDAPAEGTFVRGGIVGDSRYAFDLGVKPLRTGGTIVSPVEVDTVPYFGFHTVGGKWYQVSATQPLPRGKWVHLAGTFDPDKNGLSLYIDGVLGQTREVQEESIASYDLYELHGMGGILTVGQGEDFVDHLWVDEVRVWGVERTAAEINANFSHVLQPDQLVNLDGEDLIGGLMAYYPFDDGGTTAADQRHRAMCSLHKYDYPAQDWVANSLKHEYFYPDRSYGFPIEKFGGAFVFDSGNVAPVTGAVDAQQGEYDSDGDGLPDSFELQHNMNPFSWFTPTHLYMRYDAAWGNVADAAVMIARESLTNWTVSIYGQAPDYIEGTMLLTTKAGVVTEVCDPSVVLLSHQEISTGTTTTTNEAGEVSTSTTSTTNTVVDITVGDVDDKIAIGETWWTTLKGQTVAPVNQFGKTLSDADGDYDGDGLTNLQEYWARTNPNKTDTDEDGIPDAEEDFDQDGLPNGMEADNNARPDLADTDDDGFDDLYEVANGSGPADSASPAQSFAVYCDGKPGSWLEVRDSTKYALENWTIEAKILPVGYAFLGDGQSACILRRGVETTTNGMTVANYELRVVRDGNKLYPMARYVFKNSKGLGEVVELRGTNALKTVASTNSFDVSKEMTHLAVSYYGPYKRMTLYVDGENAGQTKQLTTANATSGEGPSAILRIGEGFRGFIDDVCVWNAERTQGAIQGTVHTTPAITDPSLVARFSFDDGGWSGVLESNTFATARFTNILFSVKSATAIAEEDMRDGDTWVDGSKVYICDATNNLPSGKAFEIGTVAKLGPVFCEGTVIGGTAKTGQYGWSYIDQILYRYDGTAWVKWGKTPRWISDVRSLVKAKVTNVVQMLEFDPTPGDQFLDVKNGVVYLYRATLPMDRPYCYEPGKPETLIDPSDIGYVAEVEADPVMPGHRFYVQNLETVVECDSNMVFSTVAHAYDEDGLFVKVQSEGMAYKSDKARQYFRKWGYVPTLEDGTVSYDWENDWTSAARSSGGVQLYRTAGIDSFATYTPIIGADTDGDGLPDSWEVSYGLDPNDPGFGNVGRYLDTDGDNVPDEYLYDPANFVNGPWGDPDNDGLNNRAEYLAGTNPKKFSTDNSGESDFEGTRPPSHATFGSLYMDGDDIPDSWEMLFPKACSPLRYDANLDYDGDGWDNYSEYMGGRYTMSSNVYEVVTNGEGGVSSNWVSGSGLYIPYCLPDDAAVYPQPELTFHFKVDCPKIPPTGEKWYLRIFAYTEKNMACPDAEGAILLSSALRNGQTVKLDKWSEGGHLRQGGNYFMAFIDENNDGQWNDGELLGFSENMPENISWGSADINMCLSEKARGFPRVSWAGATVSEAATGNTNSATTVFSGLELSTFVFKQGNTVLFSQDLTGCRNTRQYIHEHDFMAQLGSTPLYGIYTWSITAKGASAPYATGTADLRNYATSLKKPVVHNPKGTMHYAKARLNMTLDRDITNLRLVVKNAGGTTVVDKSMLAPYVDQDNLAEIDFPRLFGWGKMTNDIYTMTITESNPAASAKSDPVTFKVDLVPPVSGGGASVSGTIHGMSEISNVVIEAYAGSGFDQSPMARTLLKADGTYEMRGLSVGSAYLRAFHDVNANGVLDAGEAWTVLKGAADTIRDIAWTTAQIRGKTPKGGVSTEPAVSGYASDYSLKNVNVKTLREYTGNDMVLHDSDSDQDGLPDSWERYYAGDLTTMNQITDFEGDGLSDLDEYHAGSNPKLPDTDGDGITDLKEVQKYGTNPASDDTDADGLTDDAEIKQYQTDPTKADSDGDGIPDGEEIKGTSGYVTDPLKTDSDADGMDDKYEIENGYNPVDPSDGLSDEDNDGFTLAQELAAGTDPTNPDSDGDGVPDGEDPAPLDPTEPILPVEPKVAFKKAPTFNGSGDMEMTLAVEGTPMKLTVQSSPVLSEPDWSNAYGPTNVTEDTDALVVTVPAAPGQPIKMFRVIYNKP